MDYLNILESTGFKFTNNALLDDYPQLSEKMVIDLINGIEVNDDQIKVSKNRSSAFARMIDGINGSSKYRQNMINTNLTEGLKATYKWLEKHEKNVADINLATIKIGKKLLETRKGVMQLKCKNEELALVVESLSNTVKVQTTNLKQRLTELDYRSRAEKKLKVVLDSWKVGELQNLPLYFRVYKVLDKLKNSDFGLYLSYSDDMQYKSEMLKNLHDNLLIQVADDLGFNPREFNKKPIRFDLNSIYECKKQLATYSKEEIIIFHYLSDWSNHQDSPSTYLLHKITENTDETNFSNVANISSTQSFNMKRWLHRISEEQFKQGA